jgi:hypothetical protein
MKTKIQKTIPLPDKKSALLFRRIRLHHNFFQKKKQHINTISYFGKHPNYFKEVTNFSR